MSNSLTTKVYIGTTQIVNFINVQNLSKLLDVRDLNPIEEETRPVSFRRRHKPDHEQLYDESHGKAIIRSKLKPIYRFS